MSKYELSLVKEYVADWTYIEAVREIFQNALDAGQYEWKYDVQAGELHIINYGVSLEPRSLLLGSTTKAGDSNTIGQFGEGYKIALLVLTREGKNVTITSGSTGEIWTARFVKSRKYKAEVLTVFSERSDKASKQAGKVEFCISNVFPEEVEKLKEQNLHMQDNVGVLHQVDKSQVLMAGKWKGKVFVNGLYVGEQKDYYYGYNFHPSAIQLDRDRKTLDSWYLSYAASKLWMKLDIPERLELIKQGAPEVDKAQYLIGRETQVLQKQLMEDFLAEYGTNSFPCEDQKDVDTVERCYQNVKPIVVQPTVAIAIRDQVIANLGVPEIPDTLTLREEFEDWFDKYVTEDVSEEGLAIWQSLLDELDD